MQKGILKIRLQMSHACIIRTLQHPLPPFCCDVYESRLFWFTGLRCVRIQYHHLTSLHTIWVNLSPRLNSIPWAWAHAQRPILLHLTNTRCAINLRTAGMKHNLKHGNDAMCKNIGISEIFHSEHNLGVHAILSCYVMVHEGGACYARCSANSPENDSAATTVNPGRSCDHFWSKASFAFLVFYSCSLSLSHLYSLPPPLLLLSFCAQSHSLMVISSLVFFCSFPYYPVLMSPSLLPHGFSTTDS